MSKSIHRLAMADFEEGGRFQGMPYEEALLDFDHWCARENVETGTVEVPKKVYEAIMNSKLNPAAMGLEYGPGGESIVFEGYTGPFTVRAYEAT